MEEKDMQPNENDFSGMDINADQDIPGTTHLTDPVEEESENQKLRDEIAEQKDKYLRLLAEFDNYKRRTAKERIELMQTASKDLMVSLLDVLDDSERAESQMQQSDNLEIIKGGIQLVFNKLRNTLQQKGLKSMDSLHTDFDVEKHEAITEIPAPTPELQGKVVDVISKGYYLNDKLIRFAKVVVGQ